MMKFLKDNLKIKAKVHGVQILRYRNKNENKID